jgi:hypothetical protein
MPDYSGGGIVNLMASLAAGLGGDPGRYPELVALPAETVAAHQQVVLIVIDGLGHDFLEAHAELAPTLHAHLRGEMTSVFPSTTAAAIGTYLTGVAPIEHGLTGWHVYLRELGAVLAVLPGRARAGAMLYRDAEQVLQVLGTVPFADRLAVESVMVAPEFIAYSPFNQAHRGKARLRAYETLDEMFELTAAALGQPGRRYVYAYWPELDSTAHQHSMGGPQTLALMIELDRAFAHFLETIKDTDTLVVLSADHGHVNTDDGETLVLNHAPGVADGLLLPLCGEPRAGYAYVQHGAHERFEDRVKNAFGDALDVVTSSQAISDGWFGPGTPHRSFASRVGDFVLLPDAALMVRDWLPGERHFALQSAHGGLSSAEMRVPLVVAACGAG